MSDAGEPNSDESTLAPYFDRDFQHAQEEVRGQEFRQLQEQAQAYLTTIASHLGSEFAVSTVLRIGEPAHEIVREAGERGAAAVVMATHGRTGALRTLLGSVAGQVVHSSSTPVLLVHSPKPRPGSGRRPTRAGWGVRVGT
jgi:nucleotide-binding universal stress UspA family protein